MFKTLRPYLKKYKKKISMIHYILQVVTFQLIFLLVYDVFLKRETFFNINRSYLLITSLLVFILPVIELETIKSAVKDDFIIVLPQVIIGEVDSISEVNAQLSEYAGISTPTPSMPSWQIILLCGMLLATLALLYKMVKVYALKQKNPKRWHGNVLVVKLLKSTSAFSFFNMIFLGDMISESEKPTILKHELVHVRQGHSIDLLWFEVLRIVLWFNPLVYMYQNRMKALHEFIADQSAVKENGRKAYYQQLLNQVFETQHISFTNTFFKTSLIKKRIAMLQKSKSKRAALIKYALLIPVVFGMLVYTSAEVRAQEKEKIQSIDKAVDSQHLSDESSPAKTLINNEPIKERLVTTTNSVKQTNKETEVPFATIENVPTYSECSAIVSNKEKKQCTSTAIAKFVNKNFNTDLATSLGLVGRQRISVFFKINKQGNVIDVGARAPHPELEKEAKRVIQSLPQFIPGTHNGEAVIVPYSLPILFQVQDQPKSEQKTPNFDKFSSSLQKVVKSDSVIPFVSVDKVPVFKECEDLQGQDVIKKCAAKVVSKFVAKNFNMNLASQLELQGRQKISSVFTFGVEGFVKDIKVQAPHPNLEQETIRVINNLPSFKPGEKNGEKVDVVYSLPITFEVASKK